MKTLLAILTFPFWVLGLVLSFLGRLVLAVVGVALMACGTALFLHGLYVAVGVAFFVAGLVLFIRAVL